MSRFTTVESKISGLAPGGFQRLCSDYIYKERGYNNLKDLGSKENTDKTTKGTPDSYTINDDGSYSLIMYGSVKG